MLNRLSLIVVVLLAFCCIGCRGDGDGGARFSRSLAEYFTGNTPLVAAQKMEDQYSPDQRREGINRLVAREFGRRPPYTTRYQQIAQLDSDWLVRAASIRALNRSRDDTATQIFIDALRDENALVRLEAIKALNNVPDPKGMPMLVQLANDPGQSRDIRIAATEALRHYPQFDVARALMNLLDDRDFSLAWQARRSLRTMTGADLRYDVPAWLNYLTSGQSPLG
jgi:HEAT repeat protein